MKTTLIFSALSFLTVFQQLHAQDPTVGLLYHHEAATPGYTLFSPEVNRKVLLVNNCGELVNSWQFGEAPGATCYLLENGNLLRAGKDTLQIRDWDNNLVWSFAITAEWGLNQHHDIEPLPNGNILCIVLDTYTAAEMLAMGQDTTVVPGGTELEKIIEIHPLGADSAEIVWEWKFADHLIQDVDNTKPNYGSVADHPELLDVNYNGGFSSDFIHLNGIDYNADLDQIMVSARSLSEIIIIDHSTTTAEAATHAGGNSGKGGDFLWRWGNPQVYRQGGISDQKLFLQHDCKWIENGYQDAGKISVFNNRGYSTIGDSSFIHIINPVIQNNQYQLADGAFLPGDYEWTWKGSILGLLVFEDKKSGTHALPNGNFMICETAKGRVSEIDRNGNLLWCYVNPTGLGPAVFNQFDIVPPPTNRMFRAEKYPADYPGFIGQDMSGAGIIEDQNGVSDNCVVLAVNGASSENTGVVNPVQDKRLIFGSKLQNQHIRLYDLQGNLIMEVADFSGQELTIMVKSGMYLLRLDSPDTVFVKKILVE